MILVHLTMAASVVLGWTEITVEPSRGERSGFRLDEETKDREAAKLLAGMMAESA